MKPNALALIGSQLLFATVCLAQVKSSAPTSAVVRAWNVRDHVAVTNLLIQSHRGAGLLSPENTIESFELGWKLGTVPEADLRTTKDGVIVAFHDANFKRVVKGASPELQKKGVADITFAELSKLDVGAWQSEQFVGRRVSRIADVFNLMAGKPDRRLYLDIKNVDFKQLAGEVRAHNVARQVILASPKHEQVREWKQLVPESQTLHWMGGTQAELQTRLADLRLRNFDGITQLQLHVRLNTNSPTAEPFILSRDFIRSTGDELRRHDILFQTLPWGVYEPAVYWQLLDLGAMSFATDYPDITLKAVRDYYQQPFQRETIR
jgi:glycerophosphoryl diester phosphodiesterase